MNLGVFIQQVERELQLEGAIQKEDEQGIFQLEISPKLFILIKALNPGVFFSSKIIELPKEGNNESLYLYLMRANFLGKGTGNSTISIDATEQHLMLAQTSHFELHPKYFYNMLEEFVNYTQFWVEEISIYLKKYSSI